MNMFNVFYRLCQFSIGLCIELCCIPMTLYTKYCRKPKSPTPSLVHKKSNRICILVHGSGSTDSQFNLVNRWLDRTQYTVYTIRLYDRDGRWTSINDYAEQLKNFIDNIALFQRNVRIVLVGNSMGGLVSALYHIKYHQSESYLTYDGQQPNYARISPQKPPLKNRLRICKIITVGTPWYGSPLLSVGCCCLGKLSQRHREMTPNSDLLTYIQQKIDRSLLYCIGGSLDLHVPMRYAVLQGVRSMKFFGSHSYLTVSPSIWKHIDMLIQRYLEEPNQTDLSI